MKQRILLILHVPPPVHGAAMIGSFIQNSAVINQAFECQYINLGTSIKINETGKIGFIKFWRFIFILWRIFVSLIRFSPNLCYLTITAKGSAFYKDSLIVFLIKVFGKKTVFHFHNKGVKERQDRWVDNLLYSMVFKDTDVILLSKYLYDDVKKYVRENRAYYCPNGIPEDKENKNYEGNDVLVEKNNLSEGSSYGEKGKIEILFLSNLIESKGIFVLLDACKLMQKKNLVFNCTFVGGEGDITEEQLRERVKEIGLADRVYYVGEKYGVEKKEIFSHADIFALPTYSECFPLVLLEAMQNHLPVVSTFEGGIQEIVDDGITGFLIPKKNPQVLAERLEQLVVSAELRKKLGNLGRVKYENEFKLSVFETNLKHILKDIISKNT